MTAKPLHRLHVSDFRRLDGHREFPLDAPVVLIHGPNGAGKTSILSALELALTGEIRSLRRHDERYTAHLPYHGQPFATVHAEVSEQYARPEATPRLTVGGSRIDGTPALGPAAGQFFAERCYLDQVSLGRLLELYQYREGKEESALARFVNELLGLEQLDALRLGLSDAGDIRRAKKLSDRLAEAQTKADEAGADLSRATTELERTRQIQGQLQAALSQSLTALQPDLPTSDSHDVVELARELLEIHGNQQELELLRALGQEITALGGRLQGLAVRPSTNRLNEARTLVAAAANALKMWADQHQEELDAWTNRAASEPLAAAENPGEALRGELARVDAALESQRRALHDRDQLSQELQAKRDSLTRLEAALSELREQAGALAEALAELRGHVTDETCPVCDRDFSEVSSRSLRQHLDEKVAAITEEGARLRTLRADRDAALADLRRVESTLQALATEVLPEDVVAHNVIRQRLLAELIAEHEKIRPALQQLGVLRADASRAQREMQEAQALSQDVELVERELGRLAGILGITAQPGSALEASWTELRELASTRLHRAESIAKARDEALELLDRYVQSNEALQQLKNQVAEAAERKQRWEVRSTEGRRRQLLAKAVQEASARARATIVQRVFTESLNEVWRDVFTRLAPREPFVPSFGIPTSSRAALELTLQTVHASGELGGSPQTMLSAGNLNTAALSLFLALHLAVEPVVPCLVFDDPVQSMDEVHIAQFAGLIRVLAKHHGRQVVIAVHERELFEYLRLELSPAFDGDELITIELGSRAEDEDHGITRLEWAPDPAVAS